MLYNAMYGLVPLVITTGQNDTRLLQHDPHLSGDIVGLGKIFTKWSTEPVHSTAALRAAFPRYIGQLLELAAVCVKDGFFAVPPRIASRTSGSSAVVCSFAPKRNEAGG